jgi:signal transduction histidine kinase
MLTPADSLPLYLVLLYFFAERIILDHEQAARDQQAAIDAERARILHDMHDGMGSQLITALRLAQRADAGSGIVARSIDQALQDLRLIIDSLDLTDQDLLPLLGNLRYRVQPQLAALGIRLDWQVHAPPALAGLTPQSALGVLRIVQEALNNAVRHARPSVITVTIAGAVIDVADDGIGLDASAPGRGGRGLAGMRQRAARLGAQMSVGARDGGGTVVSLRLQPESTATPQPPTAS